MCTLLDALAVDCCLAVKEEIQRSLFHRWRQMTLTSSSSLVQHRYLLSKDPLQFLLVLDLICYEEMSLAGHAHTRRPSLILFVCAEILILAEFVPKIIKSQLKKVKTS